MSDTKKLPPRTLFSLALTLLGVLIGLLLALLAVWADYESTSYGFMKRASAAFRGLSCPIFIGRNERRIVSVKVSNPTDRILSPSIQTEISTSQESESKTDFVRLAPGEHATVQRIVGPENIDLGAFIFVKVLVYSAYPIPDRENTCGIFVLPIARGGSLVLMLGTVISLLLILAGIFPLHRNEALTGRVPSIPFIVAMTLLAMFFGFIGWWIQGVVLLVMLILTLVISLGALLS